MKKPIIMFAAVLVASAGLAWWHYSVPPSNRLLVLHGNVDTRQIPLSFDDSGRVIVLRAQEGDRVKAGAIISTLDTRALAFRIEQAQAQIVAQEQTLLRMRIGSRSEETARSRSTLSAAQAEVARAERSFALVQGITESTEGRGISVQELE